MTNQDQIADLVAILDALDAATWTADTKFETLAVDVDGEQKPAKAELLRLAGTYPDLDPAMRGRLLEWITPTEIRAAAPELDLFLKRRDSPAKPEAEPEPATDWAEAVLANPAPDALSPFEPEMITEPATVEDMLTDLAAIDAELNPGPPQAPEEILEALPEPMPLSDLAETAADIESTEEVREQEDPKPWADFEELV